jgi:hypothetical protein
MGKRTRSQLENHVAMHDLFILILMGKQTS